jgi:hypothetical protein
MIVSKKHFEAHFPKNLLPTQSTMSCRSITARLLGGLGGNLFGIVRPTPVQQE